MANTKSQLPPERSTNTVTFSATITNMRGLHARAAAKIVNLVQHFDATTNVAFGGKEVEANSIIELLLLGARQGCTITVTCTGPQASEAAAAVKNLITKKFGEPL